jgi:cell envelope opacity-associated protein A
MDAPSQNMNALSVQSLFFVNDEAMHEIDLKVLAKLPETLRLLQEQVQSLTSSSAVVSPKPVQEVEPRAEVTTEESAPSFTRRARQQQPAVVA